MQMIGQLNTKSCKQEGSIPGLLNYNAHLAHHSNFGTCARSLTFYTAAKTLSSGTINCLATLFFLVFIRNMLEITINSNY